MDVALLFASLREKSVPRILFFSEISRWERDGEMSHFTPGRIKIVRKI